MNWRAGKNQFCETRKNAEKLTYQTPKLKWEDYRSNTTIQKPIIYLFDWKKILTRVHMRNQGYNWIQRIFSSPSIDDRINDQLLDERMLKNSGTFRFLHILISFILPYPFPLNFDIFPNSIKSHLNRIHILLNKQIFLAILSAS